MSEEQAKEKLKSIVNFYKLNDENNYDYNDEVLISMQIVLEEIDRLNNIIDELEKDLEEFDFTAYICGNRKASKSIELGARLNNAFILDKLKELKENNK